MSDNKLIRTTFMELEFGKLEKVTDGITTHWEYDGTPFDQLTDKQKAEIRDSEQMKKVISVMSEVAQLVKSIWEKQAEAVIAIGNQLLEYQKKHEAELKKQKAKDDKKTS